MTEEQCFLLVLIWHCFLSHGCKSYGSIKDTWYSLQKHILIPSQKAHSHFTSEGFSPLGLPGFPMHTTLALLLAAAQVKLGPVPGLSVPRLQ